MSQYTPAPEDSQHALLIESATLLNGDRIQPGTFIIITPQPHSNQAIFPAKILEIVQPKEGPHSNSLALIQQYQIGSIKSLYNFPSIHPVTDRMIVISLRVHAASHAILTYKHSCSKIVNSQDITCSIGTIHNCAFHHCPIARTCSVIQEQITTLHLEDEITHQSPEDLLLNLAQMCSPAVIQHFHGPYPLASMSNTQAALLGISAAEGSVAQIVLCKEAAKARKVKASQKWARKDVQMTENIQATVGDEVEETEVGAGDEVYATRETIWTGVEQHQEHSAPQIGGVQGQGTHKKRKQT